MAKINAIGNGIIFRFKDSLSLKDGLHKKQFQDITDEGIVYSTPSESMDNPRWAFVTSVGPDVGDIFVNDCVLVTALKWTTAISFEGQDYWKTDADQILAIDNEYRTTLTSLTAA